MIYTTLADLGRYRGILPNLDLAIDHLATAELSALEVGRHPVDGERVVVTAQAYRTKDAATAAYERHERYLDIHLLLEGAETCYAAPAEGLAETMPFDAEKDIGFLEAPATPGIGLSLVPGRVAILFPEDAHKPGCLHGSPAEVRKIVVKVEV